MNIKFLFIALFFLLTSTCFAQTKTFIYPTPTPPPPPGNIKLLPEYIYKKGQAIDAAVGTISKENGLQIEYSAGPNMVDFARYAISKERMNVVWIKNLEVNNQRLILAYFNDGRIYATFGIRTNFKSTIKTNEELADFLLMIMTYGSEDLQKKESEKKLKKP